MTGSISQREVPSDTISVCLPSRIFPVRNRIHTGQQPIQIVPGLDNVEIVQKETEAMQLNPGG